MPHIGDRIKAKRLQLGFSQEDLAKKMGYKSRSTINKIELGINDITQSKVLEFAKVLNTTAAYLMGWEEESNNIDPKEDDIKKLLSNGQQTFSTIQCFDGKKKEVKELTKDEYDALITILDTMRKTTKKD